MNGDMRPIQSRTSGFAACVVPTPQPLPAAVPISKAPRPPTTDGPHLSVQEIRDLIRAQPELLKDTKVPEIKAIQSRLCRAIYKIYGSTEGVRSTLRLIVCVR